MAELFDKKEVNPTVKLVISMNQNERAMFKQFADEMNVSFSAFVRIACKNFMKGEGLKYAQN